MTRDTTSAKSAVDIVQLQAPLHPSLSEALQFV
jgi:hypothetical protein